MTLNRDHRINPLLEESKMLSLGLPTQGRAAEAAPARQGNGRRNTLYGTSGEGKINDQSVQKYQWFFPVMPIT